MIQKKKAIVLGGTNPHIELIKQLQKRNYYVILVDYLENPPAKKYADVHIQESTMDQETVLKIAAENKVDLVISACVDQANITACYVAEKLGLTKPYTYDLAHKITNKGYMKKIMVKEGIPTTKYVYLEQNQNIENLELRYPVIVKPADACAASGVKKANDIKELSVYFEEAKNVSRTKSVIVEEFFTGIEVSAYCFVENGNARVVMISQRMSVIEGEKKVLKCYATVTPPNISKKAYEKIEVVADKIAKAFGLDNTALHVQFLINGDDIDVIEFAPRVGGGISYYTILQKTGFDIIGATIDSYEEKKVKLYLSDDGCFYSVNLIYGLPGIFDHLTGVDELINEGVIEGVFYHKTKGMEIGSDRASAGRVAAFLVKGITKEEMYKKIKTAIDRIDVIDIDGNCIMRKDLFLGNLDETSAIQ